MSTTEHLLSCNFVDSDPSSHAILSRHIGFWEATATTIRSGEVSVFAWFLRFGSNLLVFFKFKTQTSNKRLWARWRDTILVADLDKATHSARVWSSINGTVAQNRSKFKDIQMDQKKIRTTNRFRRNMSSRSLPWELVDEILGFLPDYQSYRVACALRRESVRDKILLETPTACPIGACERGLLNLLDWWERRGFSGPHTMPLPELVPYCVETACQYGRVEVLEWWWERRAALPFACGEAGMDYAVGNGHEIGRAHV